MQPTGEWHQKLPETVENSRNTKTVLSLFFRHSGTVRHKVFDSFVDSILWFTKALAPNRRAAVTLTCTQFVSVSVYIFSGRNIVISNVKFFPFPETTKDTQTACYRLCFLLYETHMLCHFKYVDRTQNAPVFLHAAFKFPETFVFFRILLIHATIFFEKKSRVFWFSQNVSFRHKELKDISIQFLK